MSSCRQVGDRFENGEVFGTVESVKAVSELFMPIAGEVVAINAALSDTPDVVNADPYGAGWMIHIKPSDPAVYGNPHDTGGIP